MADSPSSPALTTTAPERSRHPQRDMVPGRAAPARSRARGATGDAARLRLLECQAKIVEFVAKGASPSRSLDHMARVLDDIVAPAHCAILLVDSGTGKLRHVAAPGLTPAYRSILDDIAGDVDGSPFKAAAGRREAVIVADTATDTRWPNFCSHALANGQHACWTQPILDQQGETLGVIALHYQIPYTPNDEDFRTIDTVSPLAAVTIEHDRRAQALNSAAERLSSLAANLPGVIYQRVVRPDGSIRYSYISEGARDLFGVSPAEILTNPQALFDCHGPEYRKTFRENLLTASREMKLWDVEAQIVTRDGKHKWTHAIARPRRMPDGSVIWDGIILDATRLKQANLELAAANRAKSQFLANMSHELRTPLNAIIGFSEIMDREQFGPLDNPRYKEYAGDIRSSGLHLLHLINDILDLAKIESGKVELDEEIVQLSDIVASSMNLIRERAESHRIALTVTMPEALPRLRADERKLKQILINLLSNAVKFTLDGGKVGIAAEVDAKGDMSITIADSGIGISAEDLPKVCSPFVQVDSGLNRKFEGTGLGLALTKALVDLHGGEFTIASTVGVGTTVSVRFPAARVIDETPTR